MGTRPRVASRGWQTRGAVAALRSRRGQTRPFSLRALDDGPARWRARELYRRVALNVLISNVDDHLRNHGLLWTGTGGWTLSPVYDLNPTPVDVRPCILTTNITLDESTCDVGLLLSAAGEIRRMASAFEHQDLEKALAL